MFSIKGRFVWLSGERFTYKSWNTGEPNIDRNEKCVGIHTTRDFNWNDDPCNRTSYGPIRHRPLCMKEGTISTYLHFMLRKIVY